MHTAKEVRDVQRLVAAHEDVEMQVGLGEGGHVRVLKNVRSIHRVRFSTHGSDNLALHEETHRRVHPIQVALESELHVVLGLIPLCIVSKGPEVSLDGDARFPVAP